MQPKILLVEDEPDQINLFTMDSEEAGFELEVVNTFTELMTVAERDTPDFGFVAIVLDLQIPEMAGSHPDVEVGLRALDWLAKHGLGSKTLVYSSWDAILNKVRALDSGAIFRTKAECSRGRIFEILKDEIIKEEDSLDRSGELRVPQEQRDLLLTLEVLKSRDAGPEFATHLAATLLDAESVSAFRIDRRVSLRDQRLSLEPIGDDFSTLSEIGEVEGLLFRGGYNSIPRFCREPFVLNENGISRVFVPIYKKSESLVFCVVGSSSEGSMPLGIAEQFQSNFRLLLWHFLVQQEPGSNEYGSSLARLAASVERRLMGFMVDVVRPAVGLLGGIMALISLVVGVRAVLFFFLAAIPFYRERGSHGEFAFEVLGFVEEMWLFVLLLVFSLGILSLVGRKYRDEAPTWLERYSDMGDVKRMLVGLICTILAVAYLRFIFGALSHPKDVDLLQGGGVAFLALGGVISLALLLLALGKIER